MRTSALVHFLAGLSILVPGLARGEVTLGRLFLSPQERVTLEQQRRGGEHAADEVLGVSAAHPGLPGPVTVDGYVARSGAKSSIWLNGRLSQDTQADEAAIEVTVDGLPQVRVRLADGRERLLRVGQTWDPLLGVVSDALNEGHGPGTGSARDPGASGAPVRRMAGSVADEP